MALDISGLKPLDTTGLAEAEEFDVGGLTPLDTAGLTLAAPTQAMRPDLRTGALDVPMDQSADSGIDPEAVAQNILEFGKGIPSGAVGMVGTSITGIGGLAQAGRPEAQKFHDALLAVPGMSQEQRAVWRRKAFDELPKNVAETFQRLMSDVERGDDPAEVAPLIFPPLSGETTADSPLVRAGEAVSEFGRGILPAKPGYEKSVGRELGEGAGSMVMGAGVSLAAGPFAAGAMFALSGSGEAVERAIQKGATEEQIITAAKAGLIPGLTDSVPIETLLGRLPVPGGKFIAIPAGMLGTAIKAAGRIGWQAVIEGVQEGGQQFLQNVIAREIYDPDQKLSEGVLPSAGIGAGVGAIAETGRLAISNFAGRRGRPAAPPGEVEKAAQAPVPVTPGDEASPLPTDLIIEGRKVMAEGEAQKRADAILARNGYPTVGTRVRVVYGDGRAVSGVVQDAFSEQNAELGLAGEGVKIRLDDGTTLEEFFPTLAQARVTVEPVTAAPETAPPPQAPTLSATPLDTTGLTPAPIEPAAEVAPAPVEEPTPVPSAPAAVPVPEAPTESLPVSLAAVETAPPPTASMPQERLVRDVQETKERVERLEPPPSESVTGPAYKGIPTPQDALKQKIAEKRKAKGQDTTVGKELIALPDLISESESAGTNAAGEALYENRRGSFRVRTDRGDRPGGYADFGGDLAPTESGDSSLVEYAAWRDIGDGYTIRQSITHPIQEIRTSAGNIITRGIDSNGEIYMEYEGSGDPFARGAMAWVDKAAADLKRLRLPSPKAKMLDAPSPAAKGAERVAPPSTPRVMVNLVGRDGLTDAERAAKQAVKDSRETAAQPDAAAGKPQAKAAPKTKIDDFGETLEGARKHYAAAYRDRMAEAGELNVAAEPFSKTWPEPDYQKLIEDGADMWTVAFIRAARDEIPVKPKKAWRLKEWVQNVSVMRGFANSLLDGSITKERLQEALAQREYARIQKNVGGRADLYVAVGHEKSLKGVRISRGSYSILDGQKYDPPKVMWSVEREAKATAFGNWPTVLASGETRDEAIAAFKAAYGRIDTQPAAAKQVSFDIYSYRQGPKVGKFIIGKKIGKDYVDLAEFATQQEARQYLKENAAELERRLDRYREIPPERKETNSPRVGVDHRGGADVTPEQFAETFGFRGVQFGNYVEGQRRQQDLNEAYDALMDMAGVLGIPPRALSLNGDLGLAFGARGRGGKRPAAAHYEPGIVVINLTKARGAGSLAHEWWHALDNYFSRARREDGGYVTEALDVSLAARGSDYIGKEGMRREMVEAFGAVVRAINQTSLRVRSSDLDKRRTAAYWSTGREMAARAFESYIVAKLQDQGASNDYLANIVSEEYWNAAAALGAGQETGGGPSYPYATAAEIPAIRAGFDEFFQTVETRETGRGLGLFSIAPDAEGRFSISPARDDAALAKAWLDVAKDDAGKISAMLADGATIDDVEQALEESYENTRKQFPWVDDYEFDPRTGAVVPRPPAGMGQDQRGGEAGDTSDRGRGGRVLSRTARRAIITGTLIRRRDDLGGAAQILLGRDQDGNILPVLYSAERGTEAAVRTEEADGARRLTLNAPFTEEFDDKRRAVYREIRTELDRMGLRDVALRFPDSMTVRDEANRIVARIMGHYYDGRIQLALDAPGTGRTLRHEVIHALRDLGVIRSAEWRTLSRAALADTELMADVRKRYSLQNLSEEQIIEEAVADMYGAWFLKKTQAGGFVRTAFERVRKFLEALVNALRLNGFQTAEDIFERIERGDVAGRRDAGPRFARPGMNAVDGASGLRYSPEGRNIRGLIEQPDKYSEPGVVLDKAVIDVLGQGYRERGWLRPDNTLSRGGRKFVPDDLKSHNGKLIEADKRKYLREIEREHGDVIGSLHKTRNLTFQAIDVSRFGALQKVKLYKSPTFNGRQSSEYHLALLDGEPVYVRKSNHWGSFFVNIREGDPDAPAGVEPDQFGRVGSRSYNWRLEGGNENARNSQVGYIRLSDIVGGGENRFSILGGDASRPDGASDTVAFDNATTEKRWQEARKGAAAQDTLVNRTRGWLETVANGFTRHYIHLPNIARFSDVREQLRKLEAAPQVSKEQVVRILRQITDGMTPADLDLFTRKVVLDDLAWEAEQERDLPFGMSPEDVAREKAKVDAIVERRPDIAAAVRQRKLIVQKVARDLVTAGVLSEQQVRNPAYYRHQVLDYARAQVNYAKGPGNRLKSPHWARRMGSTLDINANLLEAEFDWLHKAFTDIATAKTIDWIKKSEHNVRADMITAARAHNQEQIDRLLEQEGDGGPIHDALKGFRQRIAMGLGKVRKAIEDGEVFVPEEFDRAAASLTGAGDTDPNVFRFLAWIMDNNEAGAAGAAQAFKAISQRREWTKAMLGDRYADTMDIGSLVKRFAPDGYVAWQPDEGKLLFTAKTLPEHVIDRMIERIAGEGVGPIPAEEMRAAFAAVRSMMAVGGNKYEMVIPEELAATLNSIRDVHADSLIEATLEQPLRWWKRWVLINPFRVIKYNLNNLSGDLDAIIAGNPKALRRMGQAIKELHAVMVRGEAPSARYREAVERGVFDSGLSIQEIPDINIMSEFETLIEKPSPLKRPDRFALSGLIKVWRALQKYTQFRENWLRYAAYLDYVERLEAGEPMSDVGYGAANPEMVDAIKDTKDRAALLARELVGDYGAVSHWGQGIRRKLIPFWSWVEINTKRYWRLGSNAFGQGVGKGFATAGIMGATLGLRTTAYLTLRMAMFYGLIQLWNNLVFGDDEDDLDPEERARLHLLLGRDANGDMRMLRLQGALSDFLAWFGFEDVVDAVVEIEKGRGDFGQVATAVAKAPVNKLASGLTPVLKVPIETATGQSFWPDVFRPMPIRDGWRHLFRTFSVEHIYDQVFDKPTRGAGKMLESTVIASRNAGENAYNRMKGMTYDWLRKTKGQSGSSSFSTPRSDALYEWRLAKKFGDESAAERARDKLRELGVTGKDLQRSIQRAHPLGAIAIKDRAAFKATLTDKEFDMLDAATVWYRETFAP